MLNLIINERCYPLVGSGLSREASRVVLDLRRATIYFLYPDGSAGFWGAYHDESQWSRQYPGGIPDRGAALSFAHYFAQRIPLGLADTVLKGVVTC